MVWFWGVYVAHHAAFWVLCPTIHPKVNQQVHRPIANHQHANVHHQSLRQAQQINNARVHTWLQIQAMIQAQWQAHNALALHYTILA